MEQHSILTNVDIIETVSNSAIQNDLNNGGSTYECPVRECDFQFENIYDVSILDDQSV